MSQSCHLSSPSTQHTGMVVSPTKHPAGGPGEQPLWGEGQGGAWGPGSQTHLLSVAGESLEAAEERPGLSDHRQQGRRRLEGQREEARARDGDSDTERQGERQEERETFQCGAVKADQPKSASARPLKIKRPPAVATEEQQ